MATEPRDNDTPELARARIDAWLNDRKANAESRTQQRKALVEARAQVTKARYSFWKTVITTGLIGGTVAVATAIIDAGVRRYEVDLGQQQRMFELASEEQQQRLALEAQALETELNFVTGYVNQALEQDISVRLLLAHYFSTVSTNEDVRDRWAEYHSQLEQTRTDQIVRMAEAYDYFVRNEINDFDEDVVGMPNGIDRIEWLTMVTQWREATTALEATGIVFDFDRYMVPGTTVSQPQLSHIQTPSGNRAHFSRTDHLSALGVVQGQIVSTLNLGSLAPDRELRIALAQLAGRTGLSTQDLAEQIQSYDPDQLFDYLVETDLLEYFGLVCRRDLIWGRLCNWQT